MYKIGKQMKTKLISSIAVIAIIAMLSFSSTNAFAIILQFNLNKGTPSLFPGETNYQVNSIKAGDSTIAKPGQTIKIIDRYTNTLPVIRVSPSEIVLLSKIFYQTGTDTIVKDLYTHLDVQHILNGTDHTEILAEGNGYIGPIDLQAKVNGALRINSNGTGTLVVGTNGVQDEPLQEK